MCHVTHEHIKLCGNSWDSCIKVTGSQDLEGWSQRPSAEVVNVWKPFNSMSVSPLCCLL